MLGCDVRLAKQGVAVEAGDDEVNLQFRKTKTNQLAFGDNKTLHATGMAYLGRMRRVWPDRFRPESLLPLFR